MKRISAKQAAFMAGGQLTSGSPDTEITSVVRDNRDAVKGSLFAALKGERLDGNDFTAKAVEQGASAVLTDSPEAAAAVPEGTAVILVEDALKGLQRLAAEYIKMFDIIKIGVTGSVGKTSTRNMLYSVFSEKYKTICNGGNYNNHIGVPLTAFKIDDTTEAAIFEMGMNHRGEIELLADIVRPAGAVITNVGTSHIGNLGSREAIKAAKLEITGFMDSSDILVYNSDNDMLSELGALPCRRMPVGTDPFASAVVSNIGTDSVKGTVSFDLTIDEETTRFELNAAGAHNAENAALAAACGKCFGITMEQAAAGLRKYTGEDNRLVSVNAGSFRILNDTYNASPDSVKAAIDVLTSSPEKRRVAVLADMLELGSMAEQYHREIGAYAAKAGVDLLITVGSESRFTADGALGVMPAEHVVHFPDRESMESRIRDLLQKGDVVLFKGSHSTEMGKTVKMLTE